MPEQRLEARATPAVPNRPSSSFLNIRRPDWACRSNFGREVVRMHRAGTCALSMEHPPPTDADSSPPQAQGAGAGDALLLCALYGSDPASLQVESFAAPDTDPAACGDLIHRDTQVLPNLIKSWEESMFRPVSLALPAAAALADSPLGRELTRIGIASLIAHGTYDQYGKPASLFIFGCRAQSVGGAQILLLELIVPFLHQALIRTRVHQPPAEHGERPKDTRVLTAREQEIMKWIRVGKSNIEIGMILGISSLTVKNHVQKILRKLNVQNRTQAVSKALALRILSI